MSSNRTDAPPPMPRRAEFGHPIRPIPLDRTYVAAATFRPSVQGTKKSSPFAVTAELQLRLTGRDQVLLPMEAFCGACTPSGPLALDLRVGRAIGRHGRVAQGCP